MIYYPTVMARYSLFVLKVPLNLNPKQINYRLNYLLSVGIMRNCYAPAVTQFTHDRLRGYALYPTPTTQRISRSLTSGLHEYILLVS